MKKKREGGRKMEGCVGGGDDDEKWKRKEVE